MNFREANPTSQFIGFRRVREPYGWLGNMSPHSIMWFGEAWRTSEAVFQAGRFVDQDVRDAIRVEKSPMAAKMTARRFVAEGRAQAIQPRTENDLAWMELVLRMKIAQHPDLRQLLLNTGDAVLFEDISGRPTASFWGAVLNDGVLVGDNWLGILWMRVRGSL